MDSLIVTFRRSDRRAHNADLAKIGAAVYRHLPLINAAAVRVPHRAVGRLARLPFITHVSPDVTVRKSDRFTIGSSGAEAALQTYGLTGQGVTVAFLDSGIQPHADLKDPVTGASRILCAVSFLSGTNSATDECGHGTHVAGIAVGNGHASSGSNCTQTFYGIARSARVVSVRVLDGAGAGVVSDAIAGLQWLVSNRATYGIRVVNVSLGHPVGESYTTDPLCQAVEAAWGAGIVVVCAAGNGGRANETPAAGLANEGYGAAYGSIQSPANDPYVITVGASKSLGTGRAGDRVATYSGRGPTRLDFIAKPDIVAPGNGVISLMVGNPYLPSTYPSNLIPWSWYTTNGSTTSTSSRYFKLSGTSMAAPVVAGAAALMLEADPSLTPDTVKARLMLSADKWANPDGTTDVCTYGAGYINIPGALQSQAVATRPATSPRLYRNVSGSVFMDTTELMGSTGDIWGMPGTPDAQLIWGTEAATDPVPLPSSQLIWGTDVWASQLIWGTGSTAVDLTTKAINGDP